MIQVVTVVHVVVCFLLIGIVLLQQGRGADMGAAFGGGANTLFGAGGADNLLTKVTTFTAVLFMVTSLILATHATPVVRSGGGKLFRDLSAATSSASVSSADAAKPSAEASSGAAASAAPAPAEQPAAAPQAASSSAAGETK